MSPAGLPAKLLHQQFARCASRPQRIDERVVDIEGTIVSALR